MNLEVILLDDDGVVVGEDMCHNINTQDCIGENQLGTENVGVVILDSLIPTEVDPTHRFKLRSRPLMELACVAMSDDICKTKKSSACKRLATQGYAKVRYVGTCYSVCKWA